MANSNNKQHLAHKVSLYLDNELPIEEQNNLMQEMQRNSETQNTLTTEQNFRRFIKQNFQYKQASPALIQAIKNQINHK